MQLDDVIKAATRATGSSAALLFIASNGRITATNGHITAANRNIDASRGVRLAALAIAAGVAQSDADLIAHPTADLALVLRDARDPYADSLPAWLQCISLALREQAANAQRQEAMARAELLHEMDHATREVFRLMGRSRNDARPVLELIVDSVVRLCDGVFADVFLTDGKMIHLVAHNFANGATDIDHPDNPLNAYPLPLDRRALTGRVILDCKLSYAPDVFSDPSVSEQTRKFARETGFANSLLVPMVRDGRGIGCIGVAGAHAHQFTERQIRLVQTFADQAAVSVETERLFSELESRNALLTQSVGEQRALNEVSRALSATLNPEVILQVVLENANKLANAQSSWISEYVEADEMFLLRSSLNLNYLNAEDRVPLKRGEGLVGRMPKTMQPMQVADITIDDTTYNSPLKIAMIESGVRAILVVPLLRDGRLVGALGINRFAVGEFSDATVELMQTMATQSALALENSRLFREIEAKSKQLEIASMHKSQFLANMSHELRTPLNAIIGISEMLLEDAQEAGTADHGPLDRVVRAGKHLLALINDVLDLAKIEAGKLELRLDTFDIQQLIEDVSVTVMPLARKSGNRFEVLQRTLLGSMYSDALRVRQVLINLLGNACKFTENGSVILAIARRREADDRDWLTIEVQDTGIGMSPAALDRLFSEFTQVDDLTTRKHGGTGLGLAISRRLCREMGGDIGVDSQEGRGSTFVVRLPALAAAPMETHVNSAMFVANADTVLKLPAKAAAPPIAIPT